MSSSWLLDIRISHARGVWGRDSLYALWLWVCGDCGFQAHPSLGDVPNVTEVDGPGATWQGQILHVVLSSQAKRILVLLLMPGERRAGSNQAVEHMLSLALTIREAKGLSWSL